MTGTGNRRPPSSPDLIGGSQGLSLPKALLRSLGKTGRADYINRMTAEDIAGYIRNSSLFWTDHIQKRLAQRNIPPGDVETALANCEIIEQYPEDYPFPSCLVLGRNSAGEALHVVCGSNGSVLRLITVYVPTPFEWTEDFRTRRNG